MLRLVDGKIFIDAAGVSGIGIVPAGFQLSKGDGVRTIAIDLVGGHVDKGSLRASLAGGFEKVEGADGVGVEVIEGDGSGTVVRGLGGGVDNGIGLDFPEQIEDALAIADIELVVGEGGAELLGEAGLVPAGIALRAEEDRALVVINAVDVPAERGEMNADFGADEAGGTGNEKGIHRVNAENDRAAGRGSCLTRYPLSKIKNQQSTIINRKSEALCPLIPQPCHFCCSPSAFYFFLCAFCFLRQQWRWDFDVYSPFDKSL